MPSPPSGAVFICFQRRTGCTNRANVLTPTPQQCLCCKAPIPLAMSSHYISVPTSSPAPLAISPNALTGTFSPGLEVPLCHPGKEVGKDRTPSPWYFPSLSPQDLHLPLCLEAVWGAASWAELPGHPSPLRGPHRATHAGSTRSCCKTHLYSLACGGCLSLLWVVLALR